MSLSSWLGQLDPIAVTDDAGHKEEYGGVAALSSYFAADRAANPNTILVAGPDSFAATPPLSSAFQDVPTVKSLGLLGTACDTLSNHNFDDGVPYLQDLVGASSYPYVSSNLNGVDTVVSTAIRVPYVLAHTDAATIGVLGITNPNARNHTAAGNFGSITISEPIASAQIRPRSSLAVCSRTVPKRSVSARPSWRNAPSTTIFSPPTWRDVAARVTELQRLTRTCWLAISDDVLAHGLAFTSMLAASRSVELTGPAGEPVSDVMLRAWSSAALGGSIDTLDGELRRVLAEWTEAPTVQDASAPSETERVARRDTQGATGTGGGYRLVFDVDGTKTMAFFGKYVEVTPHSRIVWTNDESGDDGAITTVTLEEKGDKTRLVLHELYRSKEVRDAALASGSYDGMGETFGQLDEVLVTLGGERVSRDEKKKPAPTNVEAGFA